MPCSNLPPGTLLAVSGSLHVLAKKAYERTVAASDRAPNQHDALSAIILSVVSSEAFILGVSEVLMPVQRSWVTDGTVYLYVQSDTGNYAVRTKRVGDVLTVSSRPSVPANLTDERVEALFGDE